MAKTPNLKVEKLAKIETSLNICKDFYEGAFSVLCQTYLPKWTGETDGGYNQRIASTAFSNMFAPVVDGLAGMIMKKKPDIQGYRNTDNIDLKHNNLTNFIKSIIKKAITSGLVFVSAETNTQLNRSYLKVYDYKSLYSYLIVDGVLQQLVFREVIEVPDGDFGLMQQERFVVFKIGGGEVWYLDDKSKDSEVKKQDSWSNTLKEIPVLPIITGKQKSDFEVVPKLLDIAILNKVHLNLESNLANVLGVVGNPIPIFFGNTQEGKITLGVKDALVFKNKQTDGFEWGEIKGLSVGKLQEKIVQVEGQIDKLTFNMLINQDSNTVIDAQEKQEKNTSFLSDVASEVEAKITKLLEFMALLENTNVSTDAKFEMEKEFSAILLNVEVAFKMLQAQDMSRETFYEVWKTGRIPKDFNIADENERIESDN